MIVAVCVGNKGNKIIIAEKIIKIVRILLWGKSTNYGIINIIDIEIT